MASHLIPGGLVMSDLLTIREKGVLFTVLEPQCKLLKTTVAQVLVAKESQGESPGWSYLGCGAVCLIEDESVHSYFLRLYCVKRAKLLWEQELYIPFKYTAACTFFHTFPADDHHVGLNFANEIEAEEFHHVVEAVQRNQEQTNGTIEITNAEKEDSSTSDPLNSGMKPLDYQPMEAPSTAFPPSTSSDLRPPTRRPSVQETLTEEDVSKAADSIIDYFGGLKAEQRELRNRGTSQTLPRASGASISLALRKGPLPPVPSINGSTTSQKTPQRENTLRQSPIPPWIPPPPATPAPAVPETIRKRTPQQLYKEVILS